MYWRDGGAGDVDDLSSTRAKPRQKEKGQSRISSLHARCQEKNSFLVVMVVKAVGVLAMGVMLILILVVELVQLLVVTMVMLLLLVLMQVVMLAVEVVELLVVMLAVVVVMCVFMVTMALVLPAVMMGIFECFV